MSSFSYGGITLPYPFITDFAQRAVYDEVGGVDWYCTEFDITLQCTLYWSYLGLVIPAWNTSPPVSQNPADIMNFIRSSLLKPRQAIQLNVGGVNLIPIQDYSLGNVDSQNGPQPQYCQVIQMSNTSFLVSYRIVARYFEKIAANKLAGAGGPSIHPQIPGSDVLYNRWGESVDIDALDTSTYNRRGKFKIRSDNADGFIADQLRAQFAVISVPTGFLRTHSRYELEGNGLTLNYDLGFIEQFRAPPSPAYKARAKYRESIGKMGSWRRGMAHVELEASTVIPQTQLINVAVALGTQMLRARATQVGNFNPDALNVGISIIESAELEYEVYEKNTVGFTITAIISNTDNRFFGIGAFFGINTGPPGENNQVVPPYLAYGTGNILLQAAAYYDPSVLNNNLTTPKIGAQAQNSFVPLGTNVNSQNPGKQPGQVGRYGN